MGRKKPSARGGDAEQQPPASSLVGATKSKKKGAQIDDDEYSIGTELSEESKVEEEKVVVITGKKKGKKGNKKGTQQDDDDDFSDKVSAAGVKDDVPEIAFVGKKKSKGKKGGGSVSFALLDDEDEKEDNESDGDKDDEPVISFTGKKHASKKGKKGGNSFAASAFDALGSDDDDTEEVHEDEEEESPITFSGKKKKSSKSSKKNTNSFTADLLDEEEGTDASNSRDDENTIEDEESPEVTFSGKKKSSKKKGGSVLASVGDDSVADETKTSDTKNVEVVETGKSKKKKKNNKSGRTVQEEEDLDKLLAALGETPAAERPASSTPVEEKAAQPEPVAPVENAGEKEGEEETAAAKKKKKKKEKEKEKKAAAAAAATSSVEVKEEKQEESVTEPLQPKKKDAKGKAAEKKIPKHVREMQEALARRQEAEERKKKEEEEKLRKEEEERRRQEELEAQAEEAKRKRKEKEKEKLLRKKLEGKLLTAKQKTEAQKREAFKNQLLAAGGGLPVADNDGDATSSKRPIYANKKKSSRQKGIDTSVQGEDEVEPKENQADEQDTLGEVGLTDTGKVDLIELVNTDENSGPADVAQENGVEEDDEEDEWDAKSWGTVDLNLKGDFDDEEEEAQPVVKKELKDAISKAHDSEPEAEKPTAKPAGTGKPLIAAVKATPEVEDATRTKRATRAKDASKKGKGLAPSESIEGEENLRSPICCIMGHVDTGKTKLLDCIRGTNVQEGEAGGITQQIGATYFPAENIRERTKELKADAKLKVPGLLVIDTPGHESFTNLRSRGSSLCDLAILVVDIMHGLEPQTIESLNLLRMRNTEFIVALNKVDRLYGWKTCKNAPIVKAMKQQNKDVINEFNLRLKNIINEFQEQGLNTELYYKNKDMGDTFSIVPTSAISGEGVPDLLLWLVQWAQKTMVEKLTYVDEVQCTVLEVKVIEGHGTTIDVVLVNGELHEGDQIVVCGLQGPIVTTIRALLTPHPMKELRVKGTYLHYKEIKAAQGIKITAQGLEHAIAGTALHVVGPDDDIEAIKESAMEDMESVLSRIDKSGEGVYVQASTLGSLEALLEYLKSPAVKIPVSGIGIGPVHKKDVMKAGVMLERKKEYATILAFDVKVTTEARELADEMGVKIFCADIIYHLFDLFKAYIENIKEEKKKESADEAVFPCVLQILPNCVFNKKDPIVLGVDVIEGILKIGTPICVPGREFIDIGRIASIENNHKPVDYAKKGNKVAIKIVGSNAEEQKMFGRHFDMEDELVSHISRRSIDILKSNYRDELSLEEWKLVVKLKNIFKIQ
ncbi:eukaryotic translation initiation factor 2 (eIF-2) family protein [Arabidopsis thaliana]|jgi:translation initiation factor 5B|uniref:Eukaryotic translation initiation factor 5B n=1 Tax=Arabidopsis thaliana TaxID=3702 RepID=F4I420_ARATH|nr:eukaryotic translation initiation factor 2 (eIF-2) family protein [Arabidopsis thaliana]AEE35891.1 eukaryotic translation initiation factor 2 (eIF-2) family protein [Arabidopsis thaliana]|eukprot:NP_177807.3 eukaryotic translation initiation factor 2 (eIF-2) family protein [Arabidopsis thaliana]